MDTMNPDNSEYSFKDIMLALLLDGVDLEKLDLNEGIIYISLSLKLAICMREKSLLLSKLLIS